MRSVKFKNLCVDEETSFIFENVRTFNFADSTFGELSREDFTMLPSSHVYVTNSILNLNSQRHPKLISRCPWIHNSLNSKRHLHATFKFAAKETFNGNFVQKSVRKISFNIPLQVSLQF